MDKQDNEEQGPTKKKTWWDTEEGQAYKQVLSEMKKEYWASEEGQLARKSVKKKLKEYYSSDEMRKKKSDCMKEWYKTPEGKAYRELQMQRYNWGELRFVRTKEWYQTEEGQKAIENRKAWFKTPEGIAHKKKLNDACTGKNNHRYQAFILVVETPEGEVTKYRYDGNTPNADAHKDHGVSYKVLKSLKQGGSWKISSRTSVTRHQWSKGSVVTMELI